MIPNSFISNIVMWSNEGQIDENDHITASQVQKFIAAIYAFTLQSESNIEDHWKTVDDGILVAGRLGEKIGLSLNEFKHVRKNIIFGDPSKRIEGCFREFDGVRYLFESYNARRVEVVAPGPKLCLDECTFAWSGKDEKRPDGALFLNHMPNKPASVFFMVKDIV